MNGRKLSGVKRKKCRIDDSSSENSEYDEKSNSNYKLKELRLRLDVSEAEQEEEPILEVANKTLKTCQQKDNAKMEADSDSDSSLSSLSADESSLKLISKSSDKSGVENVPPPESGKANDGSSSDSEALIKLASKKKQNSAKKQKGNLQTEKNVPQNKLSKGSTDRTETRVKRLEKIARTCGVLPVGLHYRKTFADCTTSKQRVKKLCEMLEDAGMKGVPSMKAAQKLKLKKEAEDLNPGNIIESEGRGTRKVNSLYSKKQLDQRKAAFCQETVEVKPITPPKQHFANLRGIISSDGEDSE